MRARARRDRASSPARLPQGSVGDLGDQRQDDDGGDGRVDARARRASRWSTTAPARTWPAASPRRCCRRPAAAAAIDGELGLFEVDEFWLDRVAPQLQPRAMLLGNLFRDQLDRYGELETIADRWAAVVAQRCRPTARLVLNADDPLIADLGRERAGRHLLRRRGSVGGDRRDAARRRTPSTAAAAAPPTRTTRSTSATSAATAARRAASSARPRRSPPSGSRSTAPARPSFELRTPAGSASRSSCRSRVSTTSTTRSARRRCASRSGSPLEHDRRRPGARHGRVRPRRARSRSATSSCRSC